MNRQLLLDYAEGCLVAHPYIQVVLVTRSRCQPTLKIRLRQDLHLSRSHGSARTPRALLRSLFDLYLGIDLQFG